LESGAALQSFQDPLVLHTNYESSNKASCLVIALCLDLNRPRHSGVAGHVVATLAALHTLSQRVNKYWKLKVELGKKHKNSQQGYDAIFDEPALQIALKSHDLTLATSPKMLGEGRTRSRTRSPCIMTFFDDF